MLHYGRIHATRPVKDALDRLQSKDIPLDEERRAALVSNLLVVLVSDKDAAPIVNAGSLSLCGGQSQTRDGPSGWLLLEHQLEGNADRIATRNQPPLMNPAFRID